MYTLGDLNLRANYSAGYKAPTLSEIYATDIAKTTDRMTIGNKNLKSEKSNFFGLNAEYNYRWFSVSGNVFLNKVRDMIDYATIATGEKAIQEYGHKTVRQRQNINRAKVLGVNVNANAYLGYGFSVRGGFSYLDAKDEETEKPLDKTIKNAWTVGAQWSKNWGIYSLNVALNGRIYSRRYSESYGYAPHYNMWDLTTRHSIQLNQFILEPGVGVENIFNWTDDRPYNSNYATLNPGRTVYVSLKLLFKN
jgi:outer membrane receptor for ferrienterochelin and colicins